MKKFLAMLLCLTMVFACAANALAAEQAMDGVGTFTLPDDFLVDTTTYTDENTDTSVWLFDASGETLFIETYNDYLEAYADVTLSDYSEDELTAYIEGSVADLSSDDYPATYLETVMAGNVPFVVYVLEDEEGSYYYAETILNGWCLCLSLYQADSELPTDQLPTIRTILASFVAAA